MDRVSYLITNETARLFKTDNVVIDMFFASIVAILIAKSVDRISECFNKIRTLLTDKFNFIKKEISNKLKNDEKEFTEIHTYEIHTIHVRSSTKSNATKEDNAKYTTVEVLIDLKYQLKYLVKWNLMKIKKMKTVNISNDICHATCGEYYCKRIADDCTIYDDGVKITFKSHSKSYDVIFQSSNVTKISQLFDKYEKLRISKQSIFGTKPGEMLLFKPSVIIEEKEDEIKTRLSYTLHKMKNSRTLDSVFFEEKEQLMKLLRTFIHDDSYWQINEFPRHLTIMLHGVPGGGKTSLIRAIANYTKRNIITADLSIMSKNDLQVMFHESDIPISGSSGYYRYVDKIKNSIFVFEEIDAMSDVTHQRVEKPVENAESLIETYRKMQREKQKRLFEKEKSEKSENIMVLPSYETPFQKMQEMKFLQMMQNKEKLNNFNMDAPVTLADILTTLDGIQTFDGRIIIMTTNHPEKLDKALLRNGRMDVKIELKKVNRKILREMLEFYYKKPLTEAQIARVNTVEEYKYVPCDVMGFYKISETVDDCLRCLMVE